MNKQRNLMIALAVVLLVALALAISTMGQDDNHPPEEKPTLVMDKLIPLGTPEQEFKEVAVLPLFITWDEGAEDVKFQVERMGDAYIQRSYAPNVFNLQGPIELNLLGEENISWALVDPRPEVENVRANEDGAEDEPLHLETEGINQVQWDVVVPLYRGDSSFNARALTITVEGEVIFETEINYDEWRKRGEDRRNTNDDQQDEQRDEQ
jgi:hypothetical protein